MSTMRILIGTWCAVMTSVVLLSGTATHAAVVYRTVALTGTQAPGVPTGVEYSDLDFSIELNDLGQVAFGAGLTGPGIDTTNDKGIWSEGGGSLHLVAREGNQAPGEDPGVTFGGPSRRNSIT